MRIIVKHNKINYCITGVVATKPDNGGETISGIRKCTWNSRYNARKQRCNIKAI